MMLKKKTPRGAVYSLTKIIAVIVCLCMLPIDPSYAGQAKENGVSNVTQTKPPLISIPEEYGAIEESHQGTNGRTIFYIQDAHDSLEAQENIAQIINHLVVNYGIKTVFEEGYEGPVPSDEYFGFIDDPTIKERVSYFLMDKLRIGGAEYAHINRKQGFDLIGADSAALHVQNIEWYRESAKRREEIASDLQEIEKHIKKLVNKYFPKEMKEWMKLKRRLDEDKLSLLDYVKRTMSLKDHSGGMQIETQPNIHVLLAAEISADPKIIESAQQIEVKTLLEEIELLENRLAESHLNNDRDKKVFRYYKGIQLLKRLNAIEVTSEEYKTAKDAIVGLNTDELVEFIVKQSHKSLVLSKRWESNIKHAMKFYELAESRDQVIRKTLVTSNINHAALIFGGFHKENIKSILKGEDFSYYIITPKITEISERHQAYYKQIMSLGRQGLEVPFYLAKAAKMLVLFNGPVAIARSEISSVRNAIQSLPPDSIRK